MRTEEAIKVLYETMLEALGPSYWWPGDSPFEIVVGAILTQNTNWVNVEKAIANLREESCLDASVLAAQPVERIAELIRPAGYYNIKAKRLCNFLSFLEDEAEFDLQKLKAQPLEKLRPKLLSVNGIGPETADSILLYALEMPTFVVDAYTFRLLNRHGLAHEDMDYHELQSLFMDVLPKDVALYNEYHALIVRTGKEWCKKKVGLCNTCPLLSLLDQAP